jgi:hypothetical protein
VDVSHGSAELDAVAAEDVALPGVVFGVDLALDRGVVDDADAESALGVRVVERRAGLLDLGEELSPVGERVAEALNQQHGCRKGKSARRRWRNEVDVNGLTL